MFILYFAAICEYVSEVSLISTVVPVGTLSNNQRTSLLYILIQPPLTFPPIEFSLLVPCIPYVVPYVFPTCNPSQRSPSGFLGSPPGIPPL